MVKKAEREIVDRRLEETLDLFQPTAQQAAAEEGQEPEPKRTPKSRRWDRENPVFAFRILPEDNDRIVEWADRLGWTRDEVARGLMGAALEAIDQGWLELDIERHTETREVPVKTPKGKRTTRRIKTTSSDVTWSWQGAGKSRGPM